MRWPCVSDTPDPVERLKDVVAMFGGVVDRLLRFSDAQCPEKHCAVPPVFIVHRSQLHPEHWQAFLLAVLVLNLALFGNGQHLEAV